MVAGYLCQRMSVSGEGIIQLPGIFRFEANKGKTGPKNQLPRSRATEYEFMFKNSITKQSFEEYVL